MGSDIQGSLDSPPGPGPHPRGPGWSLPLQRLPWFHAQTAFSLKLVGVGVLKGNTETWAENKLRRKQSRIRLQVKGAPALAVKGAGQVGGNQEVPTKEARASHGSQGGLVTILEAWRVERYKKDAQTASSAAGNTPLGFPTRKLLEKSWKKAHSVRWQGKAG